MMNAEDYKKAIDEKLHTMKMMDEPATENYVVVLYKYDDSTNWMFGGMVKEEDRGKLIKTIGERPYVSKKSITPQTLKLPIL